MAVPQGQFYALLGQKIREARQAANLTQESLGLMVGMTRTSITNIEKGRQPVHAHLLAMIADAVRLNPASLFPSSTPAQLADTQGQVEKLPSAARDFVNRVMRRQDDLPQTE